MDLAWRCLEHLWTLCLNCNSIFARVASLWLAGTCRSIPGLISQHRKCNSLVHVMCSIDFYRMTCTLLMSLLVSWHLLRVALFVYYCEVCHTYIWAMDFGSFFWDRCTWGHRTCPCSRPASICNVTILHISENLLDIINSIRDQVEFILIMLVTLRWWHYVDKC